MDFSPFQNVLTNARETANKAIFLVTDGFSNGGDPRPVAKKLRKQGIKIFTFGIKNGNVRELYDMASHPKNESTYILDSFEEFEALAKRALHEGKTVLDYVVCFLYVILRHNIMINVTLENQPPFYVFVKLAVTFYKSGYNRNQGTDSMYFRFTLR